MATTVQLIPLSRAARQARVSRVTLRRAIADGGIPVFADPLDKRVRLIRSTDLAALRTPRQTSDNSGPERAA